MRSSAPPSRFSRFGTSPAQNRGREPRMQKFSALSLVRQALRGNRDWRPQWRRAEPRADYDVIIVGGGGHGLATAYYLAKEHGIARVAVIERGWLGGGNTGRNTTIVRS